MGLTFPGLGYVFDIHMQREALTLMLYVAIMGHADPWIFSVFQHRVSREQYGAFEISIAPSLCRASFRLTVRGAQGSQSALI